MTSTFIYSPYILNLSGALEYISYYQAYVEFFLDELKGKPFSALLEEYVFGASANILGGAERYPDMLNRFLAGLLHPMIHTGFGVEFSLPGTFAEGNAF